MDTGKSIVIGAVILGVAYVIPNRYTVAAVDTHDPNEQVAWIVNRVTGKATWCLGRSMTVTCVEGGLNIKRD